MYSTLPPAGMVPEGRGEAEALPSDAVPLAAGPAEDAALDTPPPVSPAGACDALTSPDATAPDDAGTPEGAMPSLYAGATLAVVMGDAGAPMLAEEEGDGTDPGGRLTDRLGVLVFVKETVLVALTGGVMVGVEDGDGSCFTQAVKGVARMTPSPLTHTHTQISVGNLARKHRRTQTWFTCTHEWRPALSRTHRSGKPHASHA